MAGKITYYAGCLKGAACAGGMPVSGCITHCCVQGRWAASTGCGARSRPVASWRRNTWMRAFRLHRNMPAPAALALACFATQWPSRRACRAHQTRYRTGCCQTQTLLRAAGPALGVDGLQSVEGAAVSEPNGSVSVPDRWIGETIHEPASGLSDVSL